MIKVWTFVISRGEPFKMNIPNNPVLEFDGDRTLWKMTGTREDAEQVKAAIGSLGITVTCHTEEKDEELLKNQVIETLLASVEKGC